MHIDATHVRPPQRRRAAVRGWWQRAGELRRKYLWVLTALVAVFAFVLGFMGWGSVRGGPQSIPDRVYATVALFRFTTIGSITRYPTSLEVARWLAPLTTAYAFFRAIGAVFSEQWSRLRVRMFARDHVIVCGLGRCGSRLVDAFRDEGDTVVAIDRDPTEADLANCRKRGIRVLRGDATDRELLKLARLDRARRLVAVCGDDGLNSEVAMLVQAASEQRRLPLSCFVHIGDEPLCRLLQETALGEPTHDLVRLEYFNIYRSGPHAVVRAYSSLLRERDGAPPHLIMAGGDQIGPNVIAEACRRWTLEAHDRGLRLRATLISPRAPDECTQLRERYPDLEAICELTAVRAQPSDPDDALAWSLDVSTNGSTIAFVYEDDDRACLRATIRIRKLLPASVPVVACTSGRSGLARLLSRSNRDAEGHVEGFELLDAVCRTEVILNGDNELIAQAIHENFVRHELRTNPDAASTSAVIGWDRLSEDLREANRDQADDVGRKLAAIGYVLAPATEVSPRLVSFTASQIELLAENEHNRWLADKARQGYRFGPKDEAHKLNPNMVPWCQLDELTKEKDRDAVQNIPMVLSRAGFVVRPRAGTGASASTLLSSAPAADEADTSDAQASRPA